MASQPSVSAQRSTSVGQTSARQSSQASSGGGSSVGGASQPGAAPPSLASHAGGVSGPTGSGGPSPGISPASNEGASPPGRAEGAAPAPVAPPRPALPSAGASSVPPSTLMSSDENSGPGSIQPPLTQNRSAQKPPVAARQTHVARRVPWWDECRVRPESRTHMRVSGGSLPPSRNNLSDVRVFSAIRANLDDARAVNQRRGVAAARRCGQTRHGSLRSGKSDARRRRVPVPSVRSRA